MYWLAKMVYAGEDPRFLFRRMIIFASEDVGLADPQAVSVTMACAAAFDRVGLPEGRFPLAQAALYLAMAPKSNSVFAFFDALKAVESEREGDVPNHLKDASRDAEGFGHGAGYLYPHAYRDHWVAQQYLPAHLQGQLFYEPGDLGYERGIRQQVVSHREAQLAAMLEVDSAPPAEVLTFGKPNRAYDRWLQRTIGRVGEHLAALRDRMLEAAQLQRHHVVVDLNAASGLLTWEVVRRVPEGGVWALAGTPQAAAALQQQAARLPQIERPVVLQGDLKTLAECLRERGEGDVRFDAAVGRQVLTRCQDKAKALAGLRLLLRPGGHLVLSEVIPRHGQRLSDLVDLGAFEPDLVSRLREAEAAMYHMPDDARVNWDVPELEAALQQAGFELLAPLELEIQDEERHISAAQLDRWFAVPDQAGRQTSYAGYLLTRLAADEFTRLETCFRRQLQDQVLPWRTTLVTIRATSGHLI
jgi:putative ATPase